MGTIPPSRPLPPPPHRPHRFDRGPGKPCRPVPPPDLDPYFERLDGSYYLREMRERQREIFRAEAGMIAMLGLGGGFVVSAIVSWLL